MIARLTAPLASAFTLQQNGSESCLPTTYKQNARRRSGGSPREHRTDRLSAAFNNNLHEQEALTARYPGLCRYSIPFFKRCWTYLVFPQIQLRRLLIYGIYRYFII
ncbi:hypothetical protein FVW59_18980 [Parahaliea aestuarii]|uniref:Uncharacterized protein n=1 Tax=Parahaliea aestuarii TaxID=1852021 RepID=A0A5C8ZL85_9GAMM|nr:hypothetical protein FVW59_18980 [Parahaliea aestuarii]